MKAYPLLFATIAVVALCACQTVGNKSIDDPQKYLNVREGKSSKRDIYAVFGQPHDVQYSDDRTQSMWTYFKVEMSPTGWSYVPYIGLIAGGSNEDATKVYFVFDSSGRLIRKETKKTSDSENEWSAMARMTSQGNRDDRAQRVGEEMARIGTPFDKKLAHRVKFVR